MKKILLLLVIVLVPLCAGAEVTCSGINNQTVTLTVSGEAGQITQATLEGLLTSAQWQGLTSVIVTNADGSAAGITADEVKAIVTECTSLTKLNLLGMTSLSGSLSALSCPTLTSLVMPMGTDIDATAFGGNVTAIISKPSATATYLNARLNNPDGKFPDLLSGYNSDFVKAMKNSEIHLTITGKMQQADIDILKDYCSKLYLDASAATSTDQTALNAITYSCIDGKLYGISLPSTLTAIPDKCLFNCQNITNVKIPDGVISIGAEAFRDCKGVTAINIPSGVKSIGNRAFYASCLQSAKIPDGVTFIGTMAFQECLYLESVVLPSTLTTIGNHAFYRCNSLKNIYCNGPAPTIVDDAGNTSTESTLLMAEDQMYGTTNFATSSPASQSNYWKTTTDAKNGNGLTMIHVKSDYAYDNAETGYKGYTVKARYVKDDANPTLYYDYIGSDYDGKVLYPSENQIKYIGGNYKYAGWKSFALVDPDYVPASNETDVPNLTDATWYTLCYPFVMTRTMIENTFGSGTEVCEFVGVTTNDNEKNEVRTIHFTKDKIIDGLNSDGTPITPSYTPITTAGHPYMIHPSVAPTAKNSEGKPCYVIRTDYPNYPVSYIVTGKSPEAAYAGTGASTTSADYVSGYTFEGNYETKTMPANVFYLGTSGGSDVFKYATAANAGRHFRAFTAVVNPPAGQTIAGAKMAMVFDADADNETTGISEMPTTASRADGSKYAGKVFNMQGQVVRMGTVSLEGLDRGIYIVNGKKYVVR
jgi:hypothetical protein